MAYTETTCDPTEDETIPTGEYSVKQYYDDIRMEFPYYAAKFYLDEGYIGFCSMNYSENYAKYDYTFITEKAYTWRIDIYNDDTEEWQTGTTHNCIVYDVPVLPSKPTNPTPENNDTEVDFSAFSLSWEDGGGADTYNVYIGPSGSLSLVSEAQDETTYTSQLSECPLNQKIYWRVDSTNDAGTTTGDEWNFDARPGKVVTTVPADEATGITLHDTTGSWSAPSANTDSYNVLYGTLSGFLSLVDNTTDLSLDLISTNFPKYGEIYYWKVNAVNDFGTTTGDELYFTTIIFDPVLPTNMSLSYEGDDDGVPTGTPTGENNMITIRKLVAVANSKIWFEEL